MQTSSAASATGGPAWRQDAMDMRAMVDSLPDCVLLIDTLGRIVFVNAAAEVQLGYDARDWAGRSLLELIHPDDVANVISSIGTVQGKSVGTPIELRVLDAHGTWHWFEEIGVTVVLDDGSTGILCTARNITQRRMWEVAASDVARFQQVVQLSPAVTMLLDRDGTITSVNAAVTRLLGHDQSEVVGRPLAAFVVEDEVHRALDALRRVATGSHAVTVELHMTTVGQVHPSRAMRFEMVNHIADPVLGGIIVSAYDVSDLEAARAELEYLARHDALTGLTTRGQLIRHLGTLLAAGKPFAVLFIDLDRFKPVNDLWGHETGDEILRLVGARLQHSVRPLDLVARVGGDEFVVVAHDVHDPITARVFADRIEEAITSPYDVGVRPIRIGASVGISISDERSTVEGLLAESDLAMYDTKSARRGALLRSQIERQRTAGERRRLADDFLTGVARGDVEAHLQPIVSIGSGRTVGFEALARWNHPEFGLLHPAAFIDVVCDAGFDAALGAALLDSACTSMRHLVETDPDLVLHANLSIGQLGDPSLPAKVLSTLERHGLSPRQLTIEVTEQAMLASTSAAGSVSPDHTLEALRAMGVHLSLDDFGTGYSSLTHLRRFPLSSIKIDKSFVATMCSEPQDHALVRGVIGLAHALELTVVAEGVENVEQLRALAELGCDFGQGFFLARPMGPLEVVGWLREEERCALTRPS
jgi:diguanylate cyclase (GGDEF)-like protein/PAS domain S-box-containing protein